MNKNQRFNPCGFAFPAIADGQNKMVNTKERRTIMRSEIPSRTGATIHSATTTSIVLPLIVAAFLVLQTACSSGNAPQTSTQQGSSAAADWKPVEQAMGKAGSVLPDGVYKIGLPRTDLHVKVGDVELKPTLALGSWVAFRKLTAETIVMGDLVLTEDEVGPVMSRLQEGGLDITALHNHVFNESPHILYMHIEGHGDALKLAQAIHAAVALSKTPFAAPEPAAT